MKTRKKPSALIFQTVRGAGDTFQVSPGVRRGDGVAVGGTVPLLLPRQPHRSPGSAIFGMRHKTEALTSCSY